ncbi:MAG: polyamine ABC transporter substrate-binding protein [Pseudomonadales bacterium]
MRFGRPSSVLMLITLAGVLAGCGNDGGEASQTPAREQAQAAGASEPALVNFYNWSDYIADQTLPDFEAATGIKVNYDVYDSNDVLEGKLLAGNTGYDIVVPTNNFFAVQLSAGLFQPLDKTLIPNLANLDPAIMEKLESVDPGNRHAVPYAWGTNGLGINVDAVTARVPDAPLDSWALLFDPEIVKNLADCGVTLLDAPDEVSEVALNYLGYDPETTDEAQLKEALALVQAIRPYIRYFHSSQYIDDFANGEVCLVLGWSGDLYQAMDDAPGDLNLRYVIPKEGTVLWFDLLAIPSDAPHPKNAHRLINYLLDGQVSANNTNTTFFPSGNAAALPMINPEISGDPAIYPPPEVMARLFPNPVKPPAWVRLRNRLWTTLKSGY